MGWVGQRFLVLNEWGFPQPQLEGWALGPTPSSRCCPDVEGRGPGLQPQEDSVLELGGSRRPGTEEPAIRGSCEAGCKGAADRQASPGACVGSGLKGLIGRGSGRVRLLPFKKPGKGGVRQPCVARAVAGPLILPGAGGLGK